MAKRTATKDTEALLGELVTKVSPAELRIHLPRFAVIRERAAYEITAATRGVTISWSGNTLGEAAQEGLDYLEMPEEDPFRSCWKRTTRMQREYVRALLDTHAAQQTSKAIALKMRGKYAEANIAFSLADALHAATAEIDHEDTDEHGGILPVEPLAAEAKVDKK
jgi:hypothetical protein